MNGNKESGKSADKSFVNKRVKDNDEENLKPGNKVSKEKHLVL